MKIGIPAIPTEQKQNQQWLQRVILFLAGQTISLFGSAIVQYAISWHITLTTRSGVMLTLSTVCGFLPQLLISLFAGVWADRYSRKMLILLSDGMIALSTLILAILFLKGYTQIQLLFVISAIRSIGTGIQMPAVNALLPDLVPQDKLMRVNGLHAGINSVTLLIVPAVAGGLYNVTELNVIFWIDVTTAIIAIFMLAALKVPHRNQLGSAAQPLPHTHGVEDHTDRETPVQQPKPHILRDMLTGLHYMRETRWLKQLLLFYLCFALMIGPVVFLTPLMVARSFGPESWRLAVQEVFFSAGGILGGLTIGFVAKRISNQIYPLIASCLFFGFTTLLAGFSPDFWFYLGVMILMGISLPVINSSFTTFLQLHVKPELLGRVFSLVTITGSSAMPLSTIVFGPLADFVSIELLLILTGIAMTLISLLILRCKEIITVGQTG